MYSKVCSLVALVTVASSCTSGSGSNSTSAEQSPTGGVPAAAGSSKGGSGTGSSRDSNGGSTIANGGASAGGTGIAPGGGVPNSTGSAPNGGATGAMTAATFSTNFDLTELPLSEAGVWKNAGLDWTFVATAGGYAFGTQTGNDGYNDSYAHLSGFPPNQSASAVIHLESGITAAYTEVEILLRWSDSAHNAIGYECNLAHDGSYAQIIRWPGKLGTGLNDFAFIGAGSAPNGVHDGDVFSAQVIGTTITSYLNGKQLATATDSAVMSGDPGIGFYWQGQAGSKSYSFTSFTAKALP